MIYNLYLNKRGNMFLHKLCSILFLSTIMFSQDPEFLLNEGEKYLASGQINEAENSFNNSLKVDPSFAPALQALSKVYLHKGDLKKANEFSIKAVQADEDFRDWSNQIVQIIESMSKAKKSTTLEEAIKGYESIIANHPYYSDAYFYLGYRHYKSQDIESASMSFSKALEIYPDHKNAKTMLGNITKKLLNDGNKSYKRGDLSKAISYYEKALVYDPRFYLAYFQLGVLQKKQGQSKAAIESLNKVLDIKPDHDKTWFTLGSAYETDGNSDLAIENYQKAIEINPEYSKAYGNLGKLFTEQKAYTRAEEVLKTAIQIDSKYADGYMRLGLLFIEKQNYEEAISNLKISTELDEKDYNKYFNLASSYNHLEKWNEAADAAQSCIDLKKKFGGGWLELGLAELGRKNKTRAKKHFEQARKDRDWRKMAERKIDEINNPAKYEK